ncbi:N-terminal phage integrase SAM-like domain-containing protein [Leifsonia sp. 21MFCrub1.1]|uniref:N-terminal phage integrase SAM-like domain-containing protein n=1 Tax=Leifsonia sp. 21MFCrub1.1 TaxID=1798223 RepID=UPI0008929A21|nr:N-terminal phage integrase SAM-like domain-containing protein [Leifsonia sp. 21MFCrub1.1]SEA86120.1 Phage integrase, N-terminal SAM-like domain [Leifsonia sp. 21MFCrub1.1]
MTKAPRTVGGKIRELDSGRFQARYMGPGGKEQTGPQTFHTRKEAQTFLHDINAEIRKETWRNPDLGAETFNYWADRYMRLQEQKVRAGKRTPRTVEGYASLLRRHLLPTFGHLPLKEITPTQVDRWHGKLKVSRKQAYSLLSGIMTWAVSRDLIGKSPCRVEDCFADDSTPRPYRSVDDFDTIKMQLPADLQVPERPGMPDPHR